MKCPSENYVCQNLNFKPSENKNCQQYGKFEKTDPSKHIKLDIS